jgi:hypothetical protein
MVFNLNLSIEVLARIETADTAAGPGHNQGAWGMIENSPYPNFLDVIYDDQTGLPVGVGSCNTSYCFAGWGLTLRGVKMMWEPLLGTNTLVARRVQSGEAIEHVAMRMFGISGPDDDDWNEDLWDGEQDLPALFSPDNSLDTLYWLVAQYAGMDVEDLRGMVAYQIDANKGARQTDPLVLAGRVPQRGHE